MYDNWDNNQNNNCFGKRTTTTTAAAQRASEQLHQLPLVIIGAVDLVDCARTFASSSFLVPLDFGGNNHNE